MNLLTAAKLHSDIKYTKYTLFIAKSDKVLELFDKIESIRKK